MEQRHGLDIDVAGPHPEAHRPEARRVGHAPVREPGALRGPRGPRGVDELGDVVGVHPSRRVAGRAPRLPGHRRRGAERLPLVEEHDRRGPPAGRHASSPSVAARSWPRYSGRRRHPSTTDWPRTWRSSPVAQGRVHRHEHEPGQRRGVGEDERLRDAGGHDGDPFAGREARRQRRGGPLGVGEELGVGPPPAAGRVGAAGHQGGGVGGAARRVAQDRAHRGVEHGLGVVGVPHRQRLWSRADHRQVLEVLAEGGVEVADAALLIARQGHVGPGADSRPRWTRPSVAVSWSRMRPRYPSSGASAQRRPGVEVTGWARPADAGPTRARARAA